MFDEKGFSFFYRAFELDSKVSSYKRLLSRLIITLSRKKMDQDQSQDAPQNPPPSNQEPPTDEQREQQRIAAQRILMAIRIQREANRIMDELRDRLPPRD